MADRNDTSIWKKEITFRRKPRQQANHEVATASKPPETSIWKKEITLRRKPKPAQGVTAAKPAETSIWKKEIALRTKPTTPPSSSPPSRPLSPLKQSPPAELATPEPPVEDDVDTTALPPVTPPVTPASPPVSQPVTPSVEPAGARPPLPDPLQSDSARVEAGYERATVSEGVPAHVKPADSQEPETRYVPVHPVAEPSPVEPGTHAPSPAEHSNPVRQRPREKQPVAVRAVKQWRRRPGGIASRNDKFGSSKHKRVVGLKVGASQVAAAYVVNNGAPKIVRIARTRLKRGVVVGGELREPEELTAALKSFFRKNKLPQTCVRLGISNNRIGVRTFEIAGIEDEKQLANAIRFRAQETLPIPLGEAVLDYRILGERVDEEGVLVRRVLLVVAHRELVERYIAACRKAGLKLIGIDLEAFALLRALADPAKPPAEDAAVVCISIGYDRSTLAVSDGSVCEFTRVLAWGGSLLDIALARVLDLTPSAVEPIKRQLSLGEEGQGAGLDAHSAGEARAAMAAELQTFARELVASLRFYQEQPNSLGISEILLTGGAADTQGLVSELERLIGIPVRVGDPLARVRVPRDVKEAQSGSVASLAVAVGLGIED